MLRAAHNARRALSTAATNNTTPAVGISNPRLTKTLYRQLLQWCRRTPASVPLHPFIPPVHVSAPELINSARMRHLYDFTKTPWVKTARRVLPVQTDYQKSSMTVPIYTCDNLRSLIKVVFRCNRSTSDMRHYKHRVDECFARLRSLNELSATHFSELERRRAQHADRAGVAFRIGQVVQHQQERWRGVVWNWTRKTDVADTTALSDDFSQTIAAQNQTQMAQLIQYDILMDQGDAEMRQMQSAFAQCSQDELMPVNDPALQHILNRGTQALFVRFDDASKSFVPNQLRAYEFPNDTLNGVSEETTLNERVLTAAQVELREDVVEGTRELVRQLERHILDESSCPSDRKGLGLLAALLSGFNDIEVGNVFPARDRFSPLEPSPTSRAANHIRALLTMSVEIDNALMLRRESIANKDRYHFKLGQSVVHKTYGFRGVVVAIDARPIVDVSRWDGLQHIPDPQKYPFYQVVPDQDDCVKAFGDHRPMRYVCEANLDACPENLVDFNVDLDPDWMKSESGDHYVPPEDLRFKFGEDLNDDGATERCMMRIQESLNQWQIKARMNDPDDPVASKLSMHNILELLKLVDTMEDAVALQEMIKDIRKAHSRLDLRWMMEQGLSELAKGKPDRATSVFQEVIKEEPLAYTEAYNKLATSLYMQGRLDESLATTLKVLELDPTHFQALNGLGLIYFDQDDYAKAIECFRKSTEMDPWSPVSSKLSVALDAATASAKV
jgi:hemimethylated DNA binding protein